MSFYTDTIDQHAVHTNLQNALAEIDAVVKMTGKPIADAEASARISQVVKNFSVALETCDKNLIMIGWLNDASSALSNIRSYLANYKSNRDANQLKTNCFGQLDALLQCTVKLNCVRSKQSLTGFTNAVSEYTQVMDTHNEQLQARVKELETEIEALRNQVTDHGKASTQAAQSFQTALDTEKKRLDGFATSYQNQMATDQKSFADFIEKLRATFTDGQDERKKAFDSEITAMKSQQQTIEQEAASQRSDITKNSDEVIQAYTKKFEEYEQQVVNIVGIVNTNMFSHRYKAVADDAHKRARIWHIITVFLILVVGGFAVYSFILTLNESTSWVRLIAKIFATSTLVTGAAYAARQASKQEKVERYARRIEMELVAIDPFIDSMDEERKSAIKEEIARRIFGNSDAMEISSKDESFAALDKLNSIEEILQSLSGVINKIAK